MLWSCGLWKNNYWISPPTHNNSRTPTTSHSMPLISRPISIVWNVRCCYLTFPLFLLAHARFLMEHLQWKWARRWKNPIEIERLIRAPTHTHTDRWKGPCLCNSLYTRDCFSAGKTWHEIGEGGVGAGLKEVNKMFLIVFNFNAILFV